MGLPWATAAAVIASSAIASLANFMSRPLLFHRSGDWRARLSEVVAAVERGRGAGSDHAFAGCVRIPVLSAGVAAAREIRDLESAHVDDALEFADLLEEAEHGVVRAIEFHFVRRF